MRRAGVVLIAVLVAMLWVSPGQAQSESQPGKGSVVAIGHDVYIEVSVERVVVIGGDVHLGPEARIAGDVVVLFGSVHKDPGARIGGSQYVVSAALINWIPGPGWVAWLALVIAIVVYRVAVWAAVVAIAGTLPRTAMFERLMVGWERRPGLALTIGIVAVVIVLPALGLIALTGFGLPLALLGLAGLLMASGAGLALFREGPLWPRRPPRIAYAAYLLLPPALEVGVLLTAAGGLGTAMRALTGRFGSNRKTVRERPSGKQ